MIRGASRASKDPLTITNRYSKLKCYLTITNRYNKLDVTEWKINRQQMTYAFDCDVFVKPVYTLMTSRQSTSNKDTDNKIHRQQNKGSNKQTKSGEGGRGYKPVML